MPYTEALLRSIPKIDHRSHTRLEAIPGRPPDLVNQPRGCNFAPRCRYVQAQCLEEEPPLLAIGDTGHRYRCWFPVGTPEGADALERNIALADDRDVATAAYRAAAEALADRPDAGADDPSPGPTTEPAGGDAADASEAT